MNFQQINFQQIHHQYQKGKFPREKNFLFNNFHLNTGSQRCDSAYSSSIFQSFPRFVAHLCREKRAHQQHSLPRKKPDRLNRTHFFHNLLSFMSSSDGFFSRPLFFGLFSHLRICYMIFRPLNKFPILAFRFLSCK